jgi:hypothetical protein
MVVGKNRNLLPWLGSGRIQLVDSQYDALEINV